MSGRSWTIRWGSISAITIETATTRTTITVVTAAIVIVITHSPVVGVVICNGRYNERRRFGISVFGLLQLEYPINHRIHCIRSEEIGFLWSDYFKGRARSTLIQGKRENDNKKEKQEKEIRREGYISLLLII